MTLVMVQAHEHGISVVADTLLISDYEYAIGTVPFTCRRRLTGLIKFRLMKQAQCFVAVAGCGSFIDKSPTGAWHSVPTDGWLEAFAREHDGAGKLAGEVAATLAGELNRFRGIDARNFLKVGSSFAVAQVNAGQPRFSLAVVRNEPASQLHFAVEPLATEEELPRSASERRTWYWGSGADPARGLKWAELVVNPTSDRLTAHLAARGRRAYNALAEQNLDAGFGEQFMGACIGGRGVSGPFADNILRSTAAK